MDNSMKSLVMDTISICCESIIDYLVQRQKETKL